LPNEVEIHDVALTVWVRNAETRLTITGDRAQGRPEIFGVSAADSNGGENPCFVTAPRMLGIQAVILELTDIDNTMKSAWGLGVVCRALSWAAISPR
jgi:hypothetical protein